MTTSEVASETPRKLGYRMPAEWEPHAATWLAWPHNASDWPGKFQPIPWVYASILRRLSRTEDVHIVVNSDIDGKRVRSQLWRAGVRLERIHFHAWPTNRVWLRDSGPIFVTRDPGGQEDGSGGGDHASLGVIDWKFNAWAKYEDWQFDNQLPAAVAKTLNCPLWTPHFPTLNGEPQRVVLEGGSIDGNGAGVFLTTEECLLGVTQQRNPGRKDLRSSLEAVFAGYLGAEQVLWMNRGIAGDDTHGHVDDICRFVGRNTIVTAVEPNQDDENYLPLAENLDRLRAARNLDGRPFRIVPLPMPAPVVFQGQRLPASYANFYIANRLVLVPTFDDANDRHALNLLSDLFPDRQVVGIHCGDLIWGLGAIHCMTQQQPA